MIKKNIHLGVNKKIKFRQNSLEASTRLDVDTATG